MLCVCIRGVMDVVFSVLVFSYSRGAPCENNTRIHRNYILPCY